MDAGAAFTTLIAKNIGRLDERQDATACGRPGHRCSASVGQGTDGGLN